MDEFLSFLSFQECFNRGFQFNSAPTGTLEIVVGFLFAGAGIRLAQAGYAVFGLDVEGHGKSDGLHAYIPSFNNIVDDTISYFKSVRGLFIHSSPLGTLGTQLCMWMNSGSSSTN